MTSKAPALTDALGSIALRLLASGYMLLPPSSHPRAGQSAAERGEKLVFIIATDGLALADFTVDRDGFSHLHPYQDNSQLRQLERVFVEIGAGIGAAFYDVPQS